MIFLVYGAVDRAIAGHVQLVFGPCGVWIVGNVECLQAGCLILADSSPTITKILKCLEDKRVVSLYMKVSLNGIKPVLEAFFSVIEKGCQLGLGRLHE